jgi:hypothetical protein
MKHRTGKVATIENVEIALLPKTAAIGPAICVVR